MALTPFQKEVQNLARSMGLRGEAEKQVYNTPEYQRLQQRYFPLQDPAAVSPQQSGLEQSLIIEALNRLQSAYGQPMQPLDLAPYQQQLTDVTNRLMLPPQLPTLQAADLANFDAMRAAQHALAQQTFERDQGKMLAGLFGSGVNQSTIATDAVARMLQEQGMIGQGIESDYSRQILAAQQALGQLQQGNLALAGQNAIGAGNMAVAGFTSQNDALSQAINQLVQMQQPGLQRAGLNESSRMGMLDFSERSRQFDEQMAAQKRNWLTSLIGMGASLATAAIPGVGPFLAPAVGSIFNRPDRRNVLTPPTYPGQKRTDVPA